MAKAIADLTAFSLSGSRYKDAWRELYHQNEEGKQRKPGYTFDAEKNTMCRRVNNNYGERRRIDRLFYTHEVRTRLPPVWIRTRELTSIFIWLDGRPSNR